eukprot:c7458_g1_i1.p1 GENE.c7458_g1_i1~~c7458_g1_i1.p1  ORF type:complete len:278 (+),score=44.48 c7458_g1_i1:31-834(+)
MNTDADAPESAGEEDDILHWIPFEHSPAPVGCSMFEFAGVDESASGLVWQSNKFIVSVNVEDSRGILSGFVSYPLSAGGFCYEPVCGQWNDTCVRFIMLFPAGGDNVDIVVRYMYAGKVDLDAGRMEGVWFSADLADAPGQHGRFRYSLAPYTTPPQLVPMGSFVSAGKELSLTGNVFDVPWMTLDGLADGRFRGAVRYEEGGALLSFEGQVDERGRFAMRLLYAGATYCYSGIAVESVIFGGWQDEAMPDHPGRKGAFVWCLRPVQ